MAIKNSVSIIILVCTLGSCTSSKRLYKNLTSQPTSLTYLQDSRVSSDNFGSGIALDSIIITKNLPPIADLRKDKGSMVPALIYNSWNNLYTYSIGQNSVQESLEDFLRESFIKEVERSGKFRVNNQSETRLFIEIDDAYARGPYVVKGTFLFFLFFYSMTEQQFAGPGEASTSIKYVVTRNGKIIYQGDSESSRITEPLQNVYKSDVELRRYFNASLSEALAATLKDNIEYMIRDIARFSSQ